MFEIFAFGTFWFWLLSIAGFITITTLVELGFPGKATFSVIVFFLLIHFLGDSKIIQWLTENPWQSMSYLGLYFIAGAVYCVTKWYFFLLNKRDELRRGVFDSRLNPPSAPKPSEYRSELVGWIIYWPFSGLWTLINDPVKRIANAIYLQIEKLLQKISDSVFKGI